MHEEQLYDYIKCPALYDMKYIKKIPIKKEVTFKDCVNRAANYYYANLLNNKIITMNDIKKKWDSICEKNRDIITEKSNIEGLSLLINFVKWNENNKTILADFNSTYEIDIEEINILGTFNAISVLPGRKCELIYNDFNRVAPEQYYLDKSLKYTMDCFAFEYLYKTKISGIKIIYHKNNTEYYTTRSTGDYDRLFSAVKGIDKGINLKCFYPRENVFCKKCFYKEYCKYWFI